MAAKPPAAPSNTPARPVAGDEAFLREVDEAVRRSDTETFLRRWGWWIGGLVVAGLLAFAGYIIWQNQQEAAAGKAAEQFVTAIDTARGSTPEAANAAFAKIAEGDAQGYRAPARLMQANLALAKGDIAAAAKLYRQVADDSSLAKPWRDLATVRGTAAEFDTLEPRQIIARLQPLAEPGSPWFGSAGEMVAIAHVRAGREDQAGPIFAAIARDETMPETLRARTRQMAGLYGIDAVQDDASAPGASKAAPAKASGQNEKADK